MNKALVATLLATTLALGSCHKDKSYTAYALTSTGHLLQFQTDKPTTIANDVTLSGLQTDNTTTASISQISFDLTGQLYGLSSSKLYCPTGSSDTAVCTVVCPIDTGDGTVGDCTATFADTAFSFPTMNFDPVSGQLRVLGTGDNGNLRLDITNPAQVVTETNLSYSGGQINSKDPELLSIAYNNNNSSAGNTTLYAIDSNTEQLVRVGDANDTTTKSVDSGVVHTIGLIGIGAIQYAGLAFEAKNGDSYAALAAQGSPSSLYTIDLTSGGTTRIDTIGDGSFSVVSLAIDPAD
jgi:hypothetical protein